jgi:hypothetical protein
MYTNDVIGTVDACETPKHDESVDAKGCRVSVKRLRHPDSKYCHVLAVRMLWDKPGHSGENHSSVKEDSVKRRRDDDNLPCTHGQTVLQLR